jgi:hypothetical protein
VNGEVVLEPTSCQRNDLGRKNDQPVILKKRSCGKARMLLKHLSQRVSGPWPFWGEIPEKKNNQKNVYWVSILTSPYKGFQVLVPGVLLTSVFDRNPPTQI